jgi:hypothetical protein
MKIIKNLKKVFIIALFSLPFTLLTANPVNANPWKIRYQLCPEGSLVDQVIRCRTTGSGECFANWQDLCDGPGVGG